MFLLSVYAVRACVRGDGRARVLIVCVLCGCVCVRGGEVAHVFIECVLCVVLCVCICAVRRCV